MKHFISIRSRMALTLLLTLSWGKIQAAEIQQLDLDAGWNLVAFQVVPGDASPAGVFGTLGNAFAAAWAYDKASGSWQVYQNPDAVDALVNELAPLADIAVGRAYWVYVSTPTTWDVTGDAPDRVPPIVFDEGWTQFGVPLGVAELTESVKMPTVLAAAGGKYKTLLRWENAYRKYTPSDQDTDDFTDFKEGHGYYIEVTEAFTLEPELSVWVRPDVDVEPQSNFPNYEDVDYGADGILHGSDTQTHIVFSEIEDQLRIGINNTGTGILIWNVVWEPTDAPDAGWLELSTSRGICTVENDAIVLSLNRLDLFQGSYSGTLTIRSNVGDRAFTVVANVPPLQGEWRGNAVIDTVNDRHNPVPDVDLHIDLYEDPQTPGLVRGLIDSSNALMWPVDVPLIGYILDESRNAFVLSGAFILPPGDQNRPPYSTFPAEGDADWNCNSSIDAVNPFPFPVHRQVTLVGRLQSASPSEGYLIDGHYSEVVTGMLRQPIYLEGSFEIRRIAATPFTNRRPTLDEEAPEGTQPVIEKQRQPGLIIRTGETKTDSISIVTDMVLKRATVWIDIAGAGPDVTVALLAPDGTRLVLHEQADISSLRGLGFPDTRTPKESLDQLVENGVSTNGDWQLEVANVGQDDVVLDAWQLRIEGQPVFDVHGQVLDAESGQPVPNVNVFLSGLPFSEMTTTDANGNYSFIRVPGIPLNFTTSLEGYEPVDPANPGVASAFTVPSFPDTCPSALKTRLAAKFRPLPAMPFPPGTVAGFATDLGTAANPAELQIRPVPADTIHIVASPPQGPAPLPVTFVLRSDGSLTVNDSVTWAFDDGSAPVSGTGLFSTNHTFSDTRETAYHVTATIAGNVVAGIDVYAMPSPGNTNYALNFFQMHFTGGGTVPADYQPPAASGTGEPQLAELLMVQHATIASFDLDRPPYTTPENRRFDDDGMTGSLSADQLGVFRGEDINYENPDDLCCNFRVGDDYYDPYPVEDPACATQTENDACTQPRFQMICNLNPRILPASWSYVRPVSDQSAVGAAMPEPNTPFPDGIARSRQFRLITGPLASFAVEGGE